VLETAALMRRIGPAAAVPGVAARLTCGGCGARDVATRPNWPSGGVVARGSPV